MDHSVVTKDDRRRSDGEAEIGSVVDVVGVKSPNNEGVAADADDLGCERRFGENGYGKSEINRRKEDADQQKEINDSFHNHVSFG